MPTSIEYTLEYGSWDQEQRCWRLPDQLARNTRLEALQVNGDQLNAEQFRSGNGCIHLADEEQQVDHGSVAVARLTLLPFPLWRLAVVFALGFVIAYLLFHRVEPSSPPKLTGQPLASRDFYPVTVDSSGNLTLDVKKFMQAVQSLLTSDESRAASDLIYLGQNNAETLALSDADLRLYGQLVRKYDLPAYIDLEKRRRRLIAIGSNIVAGVGETFSGTGVEIVLHDTSNPLKSIQAVQNPISGRRVNDPTTNFGIQLIRHYAVVGRSGSSYVAYPLTLKDGRTIKSTTIPLFDEELGLFGFICMNIDISKINSDEVDDVTKRFLTEFRSTREPPVPIQEIIENTRTKPTSSRIDGDKK